MFGAILNNRLAHELTRLLPASASGVDVGTLTGSPAAIRQLPPETYDAVIHALANAIQVVFLAAVPLALLAFAVTWLLPERPLRQTAHIGAEAVGDELLTELAPIERDAAPEFLVEDPPPA